MAALTRGYLGLAPGSPPGHEVSSAHPMFTKPFTAQNSLSAVTSDLVRYQEASHWLLDNFKQRYTLKLCCSL